MPSLALAVLLAAATPQKSELQRYLNAATQLFENLEYERALEQLGRAKQFSQASSDDVTIALTEGVLLLELGRTDDAVAAFKTGLFLDPDATLRLTISPKVSEQLEAVRADVKRQLAARTLKTPDFEPAAPPAEVSVSRRPVLPWVLFGGSLASGTAAFVLGLFYQADLARAREPRFYDEKLAYYGAAKNEGAAATVLFAVAGVAVIATVVTFIYSYASSSP